MYFPQRKYQLCHHKAKCNFGILPMVFGENSVQFVQSMLGYE